MTRSNAQPGRESRALAEARRRLRALADPEQIPVLRRFFKTGPGQYGEGDVFIGVKVPRIRALVRELDGLALGDVRVLLRSGIHEERMLALLLLARRFERCRDEDGRRAIHELYLASAARVDNWDLVDATAPLLVGAFLEAGRDRSVLDRLIRSGSMWERRIAMVATLRFIRAGDLADAFRLAARLLDDPEDLLHKAAGWMLREAGERDRGALEAFLERYAARMPRTMLRYAIEKLPEAQRRRWLARPALTRRPRRHTIRP